MADQQEQANCYQALFSQLWGKEPWFQGTYWWNWEDVPDPGPDYATDYTPQDKLAEGVMSSYLFPARTVHVGSRTVGPADRVGHARTGGGRENAVQVRTVAAPSVSPLAG